MKSGNDRYDNVEYQSLSTSPADLTSGARRNLSTKRPVLRVAVFAFIAGCLSTLAIAAISAIVVHSSSSNNSGGGGSSGSSNKDNGGQLIDPTMGSATMTAEKAAKAEAAEWNYCGRSSSVAKARGCVMEPFFYGWMPPQCVFDELTAEYPIFEDREWYRDLNMTERLEPEQLWAGEFTQVYTRRYHGEHCLFQWRKLQYAMDHRMQFLDNKTISVHHTKHCADQLSVGCEGPNDVNIIDLGFYRCRMAIWG